MRPARLHFFGPCAGTILTVLMFALGAVGLGATSRAAADAPDDDADLGFTDESVERAIQAAVSWIKEQRQEGGHWETSGNRSDTHWAGNTALAALALLYAEENPREEPLATALEWLAGQTLNGTYTYGTRAHALALVPGSKFNSRLRGDLNWLLSAVGAAGTNGAGAYGYTAPRNGQLSRWDNSVSQFGVLGVWMAAEAGLSVPKSYWENVAQHWTGCQQADGGWGYAKERRESTGSMTAAGLASLFVVFDQVYADRPQQGSGLVSAINAGLSWFAGHNGPNNPGGASQYRYYYLYGVERVGRASGYKRLGDWDWFRDGTNYLLEKQKEEGRWPSQGSNMSSLRNTAFALMFLCHGRAPILFNKLRHGPDWNYRMRDVAALTRFSGHAFERLINWQIVSLDGPPSDLLEAPVLYMYGESEWEFSDVEVQKIRTYCQRGGMLFGVAGKDSPDFRRGFENLAKRAFPEFALRPAPPDHPLFSGEVWNVIDEPPLMLEVHNGVRTLMLLSTRDLAQSWVRYDIRGPGRKDLDLGANVYQYATDKTTPRSRLQTAPLPLREVEIERTIHVARIRYTGQWDQEPYGWTRLARYMNNEAATRLLVTSGVTLDSEDLDNFKIAHIAGLEHFELSPDEARGLRRFLSGGGTLLADAAGGAVEFIEALEQHARAAQKGEPRVVPRDSFLLTGNGIPGAVNLDGTSYRRVAHSAARGQKYPRLKAFESRRRFAVVHSPLDLSTGLLGTQVFGVRGYAPRSALPIMRNLLLYAGLSATEKARLHRGEEP